MGEQEEGKERPEDDIKIIATAPKNRVLPENFRKKNYLIRIGIKRRWMDGWMERGKERGEKLNGECLAHANGH
uniref:AP2/ERF domain-containing protein n=1 Tax=Syphacia muris TaxID=451379 RepID=A0A0N5AZZ4_9BILA